MGTINSLITKTGCFLLGMAGFLALPSIGAAQNTTTYSYNSDFQGQPVVITDGMGRTTTYRYQYGADPGGLDLSVPDPLTGITTRYQYDSTYSLLDTTTTTGTATSSVYDSSSRGVALTDDQGPNTTTTIYDSSDSQVASIPTTGDVTATTYDGLNRRIVESEPGPSDTTTSYVYDSTGNLITSIDTPGSPVLDGYDTQDRRVGITTEDSLGRVTTYTYDANNNYSPIDEITDPGRPTGYTYDAVGRMIQSYDESGGRTTIYQYDPVGNQFVPEATVPGNVVGMTYDTVGNVLYVSTVPEPATLAMIGLSSLALLRRRPRRA